MIQGFPFSESLEVIYRHLVGLCRGVVVSLQQAQKNVETCQLQAEYSYEKPI